jgi:hypothetical protein
MYGLKLITINPLLFLLMNKKTFLKPATINSLPFTQAGHKLAIVGVLKNPRLVFFWEPSYTGRYFL